MSSAVKAAFLWLRANMYTRVDPPAGAGFTVRNPHQNEVHVTFESVDDARAFSRIGTCVFETHSFTGYASSNTVDVLICLYNTGVVAKDMVLTALERQNEPALVLRVEGFMEAHCVYDTRTRELRGVRLQQVDDAGGRARHLPWLHDRAAEYLQGYAKTMLADAGFEVYSPAGMPDILYALLAVEPGTRVRVDWMADLEASAYSNRLFLQKLVPKSLEMFETGGLFAHLRVNELD